MRLEFRTLGECATKRISERVSMRFERVELRIEVLPSDRPYRPAYTVKEARDAIELGSGTLFDPSLVKVFRGIFVEPQIREGAGFGDMQTRVPEGRLQLSA